MKVGIVGSGMAGLSCARRLMESGLTPVVYDKGRGLGGRLSTRRADGGFQFDHGAQYLTAEDAGFARVLEEAERAGAAGRWPLNKGERGYVGVPGMTGLAKYLAEGLDIRQNVEVERVARSGSGWRLDSAEVSDTFDRVVCTAPAPQTLKLVGEHGFSDELRGVRMDPCLTLMIGFSGKVDVAFERQSEPDGPLAWIALDSAKPGRPDATCIVVQAGAEWSRENLEADREEIARRMVPLAEQALGLDLGDAAYISAHRWRYAFAAEPFGRPFAADAGRTLFAGGDWCLGARAEHAWLSGTTIAEEILADV